MEDQNLTTKQTKANDETAQYEKLLLLSKKLENELSELGERERKLRGKIQAAIDEQGMKKILHHLVNYRD